MKDGEMEVELVPQGTLAERVRIGGAGIGGFLTKTGLGTLAGEGKRVIEVNGEEYSFRTSIKSRCCPLIGASVADKYGNLIYRGTSQNFNPLMATAADVVIAEVKETVENIAPEAIKTPYLFVDYIVK